MKFWNENGSTQNHRKREDIFNHIQRMNDQTKKNYRVRS